MRKENMMKWKKKSKIKYWNYYGIYYKKWWKGIASVIKEYCKRNRAILYQIVLFMAMKKLRFIKDQEAL